jgi:hypothetical protein
VSNRGCQHSCAAVSLHSPASPRVCDDPVALPVTCSAAGSLYIHTRRCSDDVGAILTCAGLSRLPPLPAMTDWPGLSEGSRTARPLDPVASHRRAMVTLQRRKNDKENSPRHVSLLSLAELPPLEFARPSETGATRCALPALWRHQPSPTTDVQSRQRERHFGERKQNNKATQ